jgi:hypothetical protein
MKIRISSLSNAETNSLGKPVHHTAEGVANFWRWFKNSKVVDAQKRPLVVYHGTPSDFDTFDSSFHGQSDPGYLGEGFYFGTKAAGSTYSTRENGRVMPVYLSLQNPYIIHDGNWQATDHGYSRVAELCKLFEAKGEPYATARKSAARTYTEELKKQGFDGLIDMSGSGNVMVQLVAFKPEQIKSAVGNNGKFGRTASVTSSVSKV